MRLRTYSLALIAATMGVFLAVIAVNLIIDPEAVLGTGLLGPPLNPNNRYTAMRDYEAAPKDYDGLLFGSSRSGAIPLDALSRRMDGAKFANFGVSAGQIVDHAAVLEFIVRSKAAQGQALRSVFLLLDTDIFGEKPTANRSIQTLWPPALTGESPWRFAWRYLTAIQFKAWSIEVRRAWPARHMAMQAATGWSLSAAAAAERDSVAAPAAENGRPTLERIATRSDFARQLDLLARFVELCRAERITLAVALSPLRRVNAMQYGPDNLAEVAARIAAVVPVWDFGAPVWLSARTDLWLDNSHFSPEVARMMLDRMFSGEAPGAPPDFGMLRGK